jgi:ElaB/YqjD/DUF883 family membrane-anchored ribosome-binding protein
MDMAKFLKRAANVFVAATIARLVAGDLAAEARSDIASLKKRANSLVTNSPYAAAGAASVGGVIAGLMLASRRRP